MRAAPALLAALACGPAGCCAFAPCARAPAAPAAPSAAAPAGAPAVEAARAPAGAADAAAAAAPEAAAAALAEAPPRTAADLAWMAGTWHSERGARLSEECWSAPLGGTLLATAREIHDGRTRSFEYLRIEEREGLLCYVASPLGRGETVFRLAGGGARSVRFENPEHDWPQRIRYWLEPSGELCARVEGAGRALEFRWRRAGP